MATFTSILSFVNLLVPELR